MKRIHRSLFNLSVLGATGTLVAGLVTGPALGAPTAPSPEDSTPNTAALAGELSDQTIAWEDCTEPAAAQNVQCATVTVPRDWRDPDNGKTWNIRISHAKNVNVADSNYQGTIFGNPGGPGGSGLFMAEYLQDALPDLRDSHNFVGFDPRGVGESSTVKCEYTSDPNSDDPNSENRAIGEACSNDPDVKTINTEQTAYDMDFIRTLLDAPKLSYVGYSYGTWLGAWYSNVFGGTFGDKFVLDSGVDVTQRTLQHAWDLQPHALDRQYMKQLFPAVVRNSDKYESVEEVRKAFLGISSEVIAKARFAAAEGPETGSRELKALLLALDSADAVSGQKFSDEKSRTEAILDKMRSTGRGENARALEDAEDAVNDFAADKQSERATSVFSDAFEIIRCNDGQWNQDPAYWEEWVEKTNSENPIAALARPASVPVCAFWRTDMSMPEADPDTYPSTVFVQSELDMQTAWEAGSAAGRSLPNTSFLAVDNEAVHGVFPYGKAGVDEPITSFFDDGVTPADLAKVQAKPLQATIGVGTEYFNISEDKTYESWQALRNDTQHDGTDVVDVWQEASETTEALPEKSSAPKSEVRDRLFRQDAEEGLKRFAETK